MITKKYMEREFTIKEENGIYKGYVQLVETDDIFTLNYAEKMTLVGDDEGNWEAIIVPQNQYDNNPIYIENECMNLITNLTDDWIYDDWDYDDDYDDWFDDNYDEEDNYE